MERMVEVDVDVVGMVVVVEKVVVVVDVDQVDFPRFEYVVDEFEVGVDEFVVELP